MLKKIFVLLLICNSSNAEVITDGTLGQQINLSGANFQITSDLGQQHGTNLFHSFQDFNLNSLETATFSGSNNINNIISRVTGGNPSNINGLIRSTIPNANFYFLNPYGIIFGPNAKLDIQGSFHASTADYLRLAENGRFDVRNPNDSLLTTAPVEAFGFLTNLPAPINIQTSKLYVAKNQTLSMIGGELNINGDMSLNDETDSFHPKYPLKLFAEAGRINLASIASVGEVINSDTGLIINASRGKITTNNAWIGVSGNRAGNIFIRASDLKMINSEFEGDSIDEDSDIIDIQVDNFIMYGSEISTDTHGIGNGGQILIKVANNFLAYGKSAVNQPSFIFSGTEGQLNNAGNAGQIDIEARQMNLIEGARIGSSTFGAGNGGLINIKAFDKLTISGEIDGDFSNQIDKPTSIEPNKINLGISGLFANSKSINSNAGNSGEISIQTKNLNLINHSVISSSAVNSGGGNIEIVTSNLIYLKESRVTTTVRTGIGNGGDISISNPTFLVLDNSRLVARADAGHGGNINIKSEQFIASTNSVINASSRLGIDGEIRIDSPDIDMEGFIMVLPDEVIDASNLMKTPCNQRLGENLSSFLVNPSEGSHNSPDDLLPSH
ncbi:MAG: filamentous hemagglutinin N-terminal domain-containing protein [Candidatus Marithrix sp.]